MNCYDVKEKLELYLDKGLDKNESRSLVRHLERCRNCQNEMEVIQQLDSLVKVDLFETPPKEYWANVPRRVTERIGLRPAPSTWERFVTFVDGWLAAPSVKWGGALVTAVVALFFILKLSGSLESPEAASIDDRITMSAKTEGSSLTKSAGVDEKEITEAVTEQAETTPQPGKPLANTQIDTPELQEEGNSSKPRSGSPVDYADEVKRVLLTKANVTRAPARKIPSYYLEFRKGIFPDASVSSLTQDKNISAGDDEEDSNVQTFTFTRGIRTGVGGGSQDIAAREGDDAGQSENTDAREFFETLLIIEDTKQLGEQRNIWLSYISRSTNATYRSLGIYRLADVYYRIAEKSSDPERTSEAIGFFKKYANNLRSLMGNPTYEAKLHHLRNLAETK